MVREVRADERDKLLKLYLSLHETAIPEPSETLDAAWKAILQDENHHLLVNEIEGEIVSSCVCVIIPNLTRGVRPYALVENVVTAIHCRGHGYATECLDFAKRIAIENRCYKMMLLTGSHREETLDFYRRAGYTSTDKTAFVQWLD